jgi:hypothetical protein
LFYVLLSRRKSAQGCAKWFLLAGGEIKNLGPSHLGATSKFFFQKPKNFSGKYWGGEEAPKFFSNTRFT